MLIEQMADYLTSDDGIISLEKCWFSYMNMIRIKVILGRIKLYKCIL